MGISDMNAMSIHRPVEGAFDITPNDSADLATATRAVYIGVTGSMKCTMHDDSVITFDGLLDGTIYPLRVKRVWSTGTTVGGVIGLI